MSCVIDSVRAVSHSISSVALFSHRAQLRSLEWLLRVYVLDLRMSERDPGIGTGLYC